MLCVVAAEKEFAEKVKDNLKGMKKFSDWEFEVCANAWDLESYIDTRPDVLLLGRSLPGEDPVELLQHIPAMFTSTHLVLMVGRLDEKTRLYVKAAAKVGLTNFVTGNLPDHPGDRPYNLVAAMTTNREGLPVFDDSTEEPDEPDEPDGREPETGKDAVFTTERPAAAMRVTDSIQPEILPEPDELNMSVPPVAQESVQVKHREPAPQVTRREKMQPMRRPEIVTYDEQDDLTDTNGPADKFASSRSVMEQYAPALIFERDETHHPAGILTIVCTNKGGSGKTTIATTLAQALAKSAVKVCIIDLDFAGPDVATFFGADKGPGIEALADKPVAGTYIDDLLVKKNDYLYILPGPSNKTIPLFEKGKLVKIIRYLQSVFPVVIADTPANFWAESWLEEVFRHTDLLLAVVDQSLFNLSETMAFTPKLHMFGVNHSKIRLVLNNYSSKLKNPKEIEAAFNKRFKKGIPREELPRIIATIPHNWDQYVKNAYKGQAVGLDGAMSPWHRLAAEVARQAGYTYSGRPAGGKTHKKKGFMGLFGGLLKGGK